VQYRKLGTTGMSVSNLCLGAMLFGPFGNRDADESVRMIHAALDAGVNFIDTADVYSRGVSEEIVGRAMAGRRDDVVISTKFHGVMGDDLNRRGNSRRWIIRACEDSLRRLGTDWIDLYFAHRPEADIELDETLGALSDLVHQGKVRYLGSSTFPAEQIVEAQWTAQRRSRERFVCEQPPYSIFARAAEAAVLPTCQRYGMGVIPWSPLNGGWLTGRYRKGAERPTKGRIRVMPERYDPELPAVARKYDIIEELAALADDVGCPLTHLALAFVLRHPAITAAIIGPRTMEQLLDQLPASDLVLDDAAMDRIDELVPPGTDVDPFDDGTYISPERLDAWRRRRPLDQDRVNAPKY
jgi:aryl-alcohol dehydrogenase-like predicted oxidoreductase